MPIRRSGRRRMQTVVAYPYASQMTNATMVARRRSRPLRRRPAAGRRVYRRYGGPSATATVTKQRNEVGGGDYSQFTTQNMVTGRKPRNTLAALTKHFNKSIETTIFKWNGIRKFDDYGYYGCGIVNQDVNTSLQPLYLYELTAVNNYSLGGYIGAQPFYRAMITPMTGKISWVLQNNIIGDGITASTYLSNEKYPTTTPQNVPLANSRMRWTDVRLNLWGAKNKAVKFVVQLIKFKEIDFDPQEQLNATANDFKHSQYWQNHIKSLTYNPIATTGGNDRQLRGKVKVLKSFTKIIQPTSSSENDTDGHVHTLKWFMKWYRDLSYTDQATMLGSYGDVVTQADYVYENQVHSNSPRPKDKIFLLIKATNYTEQGAFDNATCGSFDLAVRSCHEVDN